MRKTIVLFLGLASLGALTQLAAAEQKNCEEEFSTCATRAETLGGMQLCEAAADICTKKNNKLGYDRYGERTMLKAWEDYQKSKKEAGGLGSIRGGSKPKPGAHRTADGGIPMVTPEGQEWVWNGKYTTVVLFSRSNYSESITVMQGDPDVSLTKVVNGRRYNVADPAYAAAVAAEQAKASGSKSGSKGGTKVGYHPPAGPVATGVATFNAPSQPAPVAGAGAVGSGSNANAQKTPALQRQNAVGTVLGPTGIFGADRPKLHAN